MKKRLFSILLILCMVLVMTPTAAFAEGETRTPVAKEVGTTKELTDALEDSTKDIVKLTDDITITESLTINRTVTLDLNDHVLRMTGNDSVIKVGAGGKLTLTDSAEMKTVKKFSKNDDSLWTLDKTGEQSVTGGVYVATNGTFTMNDGNIAGCIAGSGGGVYVATGGTFNMSGGTFYGGLDGTIAAGYCTVTYYAGSYEEPYAVQIVQSGGFATTPAAPELNGLTFGGWYTDEACTDGKEYGFEKSVTEDLALYAKSLYNIRIIDKDSKEYHVTDRNCTNVLGDGTVSYTPGYGDVGKTLTEDDWNRALRGETVEGLQLPKLTLNGANLQSISMTGTWGSDENTKLLSTMLQIELVGDNTVVYNGNSGAAISANYLIVTGSGSLKATATGQRAGAITIESMGGAYYQYGGDVTLYGEYSGLSCTEANFEFAAGKLTVNAKKIALYCDLDDHHFKITSDTTTFYCGNSEEPRFEIKSPFTKENISNQLQTAIEEGQLQPGDGSPGVHYAQLTSNHTVTFDSDGGSAVKARTVDYGETVMKPKDPVRSGYTFVGWYLGENVYNFDAPVTKDLTVKARWSYNGGSGSSYTYHTIQASVNANGSISPSGKVSVREGRDQTFTITPDQGYDVADVKIDGKSIGAVRSYTFENVKGSHTIEVEIDREEVIKQAKAEELTASILLTARSVKTAKKNVKVRLEMDAESAAAVRELQTLGYTAKHKFYRSEKKARQYEAKLTKTSKVYVNTQGEKGKRYYYKARVMVYDPSGKLVTYSKLTQCKYAERLWTK